MHDPKPLRAARRRVTPESLIEAGIELTLPKVTVKAMAEKIGFDAYGVGEDMPDPVARAINQLLDHLQAVDGRLEGMCGALKDLGSNYCAKDLPELREEDFACVKDKDQSQAS